MSTAFPFYLAMTAAEFHRSSVISQPVAWMACHFSCYGTGLSNLPTSLPQDSMLIVNDRTPVCGHDSRLIVEQLAEAVDRLHPECILLDFQRPNYPETATIAKAIVSQLACPVGVAEGYADTLDCPVFLPPPPLDQPLKFHLQPWEHREIWLEAALDKTTITVTEDGSTFSSGVFSPDLDNSFREESLFCHYRVETTDTSAQFHLFRTREDLSSLLETAESLGVTRAVGLYQELSQQ